MAAQVKLTANETTALKFIYQQGLDAMVGKTSEHLKNDNMSWFSGRDLMEHFGISQQAAGGIMNGLARKGLVSDSENGSKKRESEHRKKACWTLTDAGIDLAATL